MIDRPAAGQAQVTEVTRIADPVPVHPLLDGLKEIGRGESSIVLDAGDGQRVFKVLSSPADYYYLAADDRPTGLHFPRVYADHGIVGKATNGYSFRLLEIERLLPVAGPAEILGRRLSQAYWEGCEKWANLGVNRGRLALYHIAQEPPSDFPVSLVQALRALSDFIEEYPVQPDILNPDNIMMRPDGTLVLSDPVFLP
ncbi:MAG TPA: hypothetical protein PKM60_08110 [Zoogloea sp.]|jgi:hypothetical protein|uniref:hypothetical protein n=1 Tax=Zoogloea sp. TaxID=49181 RepID=UPI001B712A4B|nr:hypothetical protein [Zoogloea sp.]MBP8266495.1 hypothetical protein [Zoogloea sp.]HOB46119.1 hypothetical protein [Zoogloea sp.]HQA10090.1 hypothetical protein [Zoogloea sp.]HQE38998.1 hypothetical protein [Zoogloea sp.]